MDWQRALAAAAHHQQTLDAQAAAEKEKRDLAAQQSRDAQAAADAVLDEGLAMLRACPRWDSLHGLRCWKLGRAKGMANTDAGQTVDRYLVVVVEDGRIVQLDLGRPGSSYAVPETPAVLDHLGTPYRWDEPPLTGRHHAPIQGPGVDRDLVHDVDWYPGLQDALATAILRYST